MDAYYSYLNDLISTNKAKFSGYPELKWMNPYEASEFQEIRDNLLKAFEGSALFKGTKPFYGQISQGCSLCGLGEWSCLFITGQCNANCFYCPTAQNNDDLPSSQGLTFATPESYAEYVAHFNFKGVSFSGGEPLLVENRVVDYLAAIRKTCAPDIYTWMYTNGLLANERIFETLAKLQLNEVRFDIGATNYNLDKISFAKGRIKNISIEIPCIPDEKDSLMALLPDMIKAGVTNLNLHQLRLTEHNVSKLKSKGYTYIPAEKPIVLESELAALEIMNYAKNQNLEIGINYCSFYFKNRFQSVGFRGKIAKTLMSNDYEMTEKSFLRSKAGVEPSYSTLRITDVDRILENASILNLVNKNYFYTIDKVYQPTISESINYKNNEKLVDDMHNIKVQPELFKIWQYESIEEGLREY